MSSFTTKTVLPPSKLSLLDYLDEGRFNDWLSHNGKMLGYILIGALLCLALIFALGRGSGGASEKQYLQAANDFALLSKATDTQNTALSDDALQRLEAIMKKQPELHAAYDGAIAQSLLNHGQLEQATPFAKRTLERTKTDSLLLYADYAATTLLISKGYYQEALQQAESLQQKMIDILEASASHTERPFGNELFAFNLLRIGMLQQAVGDKTGELQTWHQWMQYAGLESSKPPFTQIDSQAFRTVMQQLAVGASSLPTYIAHRQKLLEQ